MQALLSMHWRFFFAHKGQFLTSDNPVYFHEGIGLVNQDSELSIPFSSAVTLWASRHPGKVGSYHEASPAVVKELNRRTAKNAERYVYSVQNEPWVLPFVLKNNYTVNRLR